MTQRIILVRPAVEAGEKLGFLPGDMQEKVNPYLRPLFDGLMDMFGPEEFTRLRPEGTDRSGAACLHARTYAGEVLRHSR